MPLAAKAYIGTVIAAGGAVFGLAVLQWGSPDLNWYLPYFALAALGSLWKLRLPGIKGTYSLGFFFTLIGILAFSLPETLLACIVAVLAQTYLLTDERPTVIQTLFNVANLTLSIGICYLAVEGPLAEALEASRPATLALVACLYFVTNTVLVSGVLSLLQGKPIRTVCLQWYEWSFPYYLVGSVIIALLPLDGRAPNPLALLVLLPPLYLVHFYYGLSDKPRGGAGDNADYVPLPTPAKLFVSGVITAGLTLLTWGIVSWQSGSLAQFACFCVAALLTSFWKVRLPRVTGTISATFVVTIVAVFQLQLPEILVVAAIAAIGQTLWRAETPPQTVHVIFNVATLILGSAAAYGVCQWAEPLVGGSLPFLVVLAAMVQYSTSTVLVAVTVCLAESRPLRTVCGRCWFWSLPYYLVGSAFAGLMVETSRSAGWQISFLVLPLMALVYVSYRLHVGRMPVPVSESAK